MELGPGFQVFATKREMHTAILGLPYTEIEFHLPAPYPTQYFCFDRHAASLGGQEAPCWLYSVYGYMLSDVVHLVRFCATQEIQFLSLPRPVIFPW